jgi:hypothetical protein
MNNIATVYTSGPISGLTFNDCTSWREYVARAFPPHIQAVSPLRAKQFLKEVGTINKSYEISALSKSRGINTRDHFDVLRSTVMLVNLLDATSVSIGTVGEMAWAWDHQIPIVCAIESDGSNVHEHPMLNEWIDYRVPTLDEAIETTVAIISTQEKYIWTNIPTLKLLKEENKLDLNPESIHEN